MVSAQQKIDLARLIRQLNPGSEENEEYLTLVDAILEENAPNNVGSIGGSELKVTTADFVKNANITVVDVPGLESSALAINTSYRIELELLTTTPSTVPDLDLKFIGPAAATFDWSFVETPSGLIANNVINVEAVIALGAGVIGMGRIVGILRILGTAGTIKLQAAQNTSTVEDTKILSSSLMKVTRIL